MGSFCPITAVHWLSVLVATATAFAVGSLWYSPLLFGKAWQKELGISDEAIQGANMPLIFTLAFLLNLVMAAVLDVLIGRDAGLVKGVVTALIMSLAFIATALGINYLFSRKSLKLYLIDAGYFVLFFLIMGAILGAW
jgi:hypothetical protein